MLRIKNKYQMKENKELKVTNNNDVDNFNPNDYQNLDHIHMDLTNSKLDQARFFEIFDRLAKTKQDRKFHLDLTNVDLDSQKIERIVNCFEKWKDTLTNLHLHFYSTKLDDEQFDKLFYAGVSKLQNLTKIHISLKEANMSTAKLISLENLMKKLTKVTNVRMNVSRENLMQKEIDSFESIVKNRPTNDIQWT
jgi:hypothetical protein